VIVKATFKNKPNSKIMKKKQVIIGIDVSKATLDVFIHGFNYYFVVENSPKGFALLLETAIKKANCNKEDLFFCFENTGKYSRMLSVFLHTQSLTFAMEPALKIKRSLGITRGKNDKVDSRRIAIYAYEKRESIIPTVLPDEKIDQIKSLLSLREKLIRHRTAYKNGITDLYDCYKDGENNMIREVQQRLKSKLDEEIEKIEKQIKEIIKHDDNMSENFKLILSVRAIGEIVGFYLIAYTANFTKFVNARAFACYVGIAPFGYSSGTVSGTPRVHPLANKYIKSLLNLAAMSAVQIRGEYQQYYNRRVNELGKNKMSTLNIIRNKIIFRAFAVIQRGTPYVDLFKFAA
jgi:transposase